MTKKDIVLEVAERPELSELTQTQIKLVMQAVLDHIIDSLLKGQNIELRNFGVFKVRHRKARMARNPRTGQKVHVSDRKVVVFKPGLIMKQKLK
jgi:nucleoid DNA-binding protein